MLLYIFVEKDGVLHKVPANKDKMIVFPRTLCSAKIARPLAQEAQLEEDSIICAICLSRLPEFENWYETLEDSIRERLFS